MFFYISTNGQMTWNAFRAWLVTDEAMHILEDLPGSMDSYELEKWLRGGDSLRRRERIARECVSIARGDEYFRDRCIFRGDTGDAGSPSDCNCVRGEWRPFQVLLTGTEFGRLVDKLPEIDLQLCEDAGLDQAHLEDRRIVRVLFRAFVARIRELRVDCYSSAMLRLESLPCACPRKKRHDRWFVISYSSNEGQPNDGRQSNYLPWAYKTAKKAKAAVKRLAERIIPRDWDRYKIVIDDGAATITEMPRPHQGEHPQHQAEIRLQVKDEAVIVPKDRLIPIDEPPVGDWEIAQANDWEMRNLTMEEWLERLDACRVGSEAAAAAAEKCDWRKIDFERLDQDQWVRVLRYRPDLFDKCPFVNDFYDEQWCALLRRQPQFADRFERLDQLAPRLWCFLLRRQPQFADRFHAWNELGGTDWDKLLKDQPQFIGKCDLDNADEFIWGKVIEHFPEYADRCPWNKFDGHIWGELLAARPEYASRCDWSKLSGHDWERLLEHDPGCVGHCDIDKLDPAARYRILMAHPELAKQIGGWEQFSEMQRMCLLKKSALFCQFVDWGRLPIEKKVDYLLLRPEFQDKMDWGEVTDERDWFRLLSAVPQYRRYAFGREGAESRSYVWIGQSGAIVVIPVCEWIKDFPKYPVDARERAGWYKVTPWGIDYDKHQMNDEMCCSDAASVVDKIFCGQTSLAHSAIAIDGVYAGGKDRGVENFASTMKYWFVNNSTSIKILYLECGSWYHASMLEWELDV